MLSDDLERLLAPDYLADLSERDMAELRSLRAECGVVETQASYLRRLVQGRLDIVAAHHRARRRPGSGGAASELVEQLPTILAENVRAPGPGRLPTQLFPAADDDLTAELDALISARRLGSLSELTDADLDGLLRRLEDLERRVSSQRRRLLDRIDLLEAEVARRYSSGEASVDSVLP